MKTKDCKHKFDTVVEWEFGAYFKNDPQTETLKFARQKESNIQRARKIMCSSCLETKPLILD